MRPLACFYTPEVPRLCSSRKGMWYVAFVLSIVASIVSFGMHSPGLKT